MIRMFSLICLIAILALQGCGEKAPSTELDEKLNALSSKLDNSINDIEQLKKETSKASMNNMFNEWETIAFLNTGSTAFQPIKTMIGTITVKIADIQPFANGSKVTLVFGNPHSANLSSIKFKIDYGSMNEDGLIKDNSEKTKEINLTETLFAGSWVKVPVVLEGLQVTNLGYVRIHDFLIESIALRGKNR